MEVSISQGDFVVGYTNDRVGGVTPKVMQY